MSENDHTILLVNIDKKVDEVKDKLHSIETTQVRMEGDLKYHIKRTDLLEEQVELINKQTEPLNSAKILFKLIPLLTGAVIAILTIIKLLKN
jgi:hypothetical protein